MSTEQPHHLPITRRDERQADPDGDLTGLAVGLGLSVAQVHTFARVRQTLLTWRSSVGGTDLAAPEHAHQLRAAEQRRADRPAAPTRPADMGRRANDKAAR